MNCTPGVIKIEDDSDDENDHKCREFRSVNGTSFEEITLLRPIKPIKRTNKAISDLSDPELRKPFLYGWQRELVYRCTINDKNKVNADIYYKTPTGSKMRSMREVSEYLKSRRINHLTSDNFSFARGALGIDDPNLEIVRMANKHTKKQHEVKEKRKYTRRNQPKSLSDDLDITIPEPEVTKPKPVKCFRAVSDPVLRKPFRYGWKREVIFRTSDDDPNRRVDADYITPNGQRVKTLKEIAEYLQATNCKYLTTSNFTFCSGALGLKDHSKEIIIKAYLYEGDIDKIVEQNVPEPNIATPLQDPKLLKPFLYGWKRELVYRLAPEKNRPPADAYYYPPTGEKLRSFTGIAQYLTKTGCKELSIDNFSFFRRPLGINDPEKEIIRSAYIKQSLSKRSAKHCHKSEIDEPMRTKRKYRKRKPT